jgi:hypothetical protein
MLDGAGAGRRAPRDEDPAELNALLLLANSSWVMFHDASAIDRARRGIERRLGSAG